MQHYDIAIIGGGIAGISLAYFLAPHRSVVVLEREEALGYHSTGRSAAEFTLRDNAPAVNTLAAISHPFMADPPEGFSETPLLRRRGSVMIGAKGKEERIETLYQRSKAAGASVEKLTVEAALTHVPFLDPDSLGGAYFDPDYWDIDVDALMQGYVRGARRNGAEFLQGRTLESATLDDGRWTIDTGKDQISVDLIVNAAGGWADTVAALCGVRPLSIVPHRRTAITVDLPEGIDVGLLPEINEVDEEFYFKPDAGRLLVSPADATPCEPADVQPEEIDIAYAAHHLEQATTLSVRRVASSWAGMRSFSTDRLPVVGPATDNPAFFWLAGQGGYGILTSPALGSLAAALIAETSPLKGYEQHELDAEVFSPARFQ
ncbi:FAD-dependent oxidoreductase [Sinorhizobium sp. BG8]|uniref:NAD(P)/FAD-dependent oxidoreductase n=1 Tax=Sinorhizobium sp. BG8 TaxID=2613773 RepID=UPI00193DEC3E|nr:FAD-dependent oxidoreductase [Sinorhizobium sp. BG8]QRM55001.1 FAD-binding oxidoreductase [Sinorhizobium sp. BG8]